MSQDQQPSSEPAVAPTEPSAPSVYTAAEIRANILAKTGAQDMGAFHPAAARVAAPVEPPVDVEPSVPTAPAATASQSGDVAAELAAMRAEVAALQARAQPEPETPPTADPAKPAHPLEAHAKSVLGPGAQPKHVEQAVGIIEEAMQWEAFDRWHEANPSESSASERARASKQLAALRSKLDGLSELATLHAQLAEIRAEAAKAKQPDPEQQKRERSEFLTGKIFTAEVLGAHHPNLWAAMQTAPAMRTLVQEKLLALPYDTEFYSRGDAILHSLDAQCAPAPAADKAPVAVPRQPPRPAQPPPPPQPPAPTGDQPFLTRRDFWARVENGFAARGRA